MQDSDQLALQADRLVRLTKKATTNLSSLAPNPPPEVPPQKVATSTIEPPRKP